MLSDLMKPCASVLLLCLSAQLTAQEPQPDFTGDAKKYVIEFPADRARLTLHEKSLLNWTNPIRQKEKGETFVWMHRSRPYAIATFFTYAYNDKTYLKHEFHSLAPGPLQTTFDGAPAWTPKSPGLTWVDFSASPAPANTRVARLLQMRQLARTFRAELNSPKNERTELRLAPRPLFEYSSPETGVLDGAILSFVVATDPEVLLLIEAYDENRNGKPATGFRYAFARFHYWDVSAYLNDTRVWHAELDKAHETNNLGDRENIGKIYNSFHAYPGGTVSAGSP